MSNYLGFMPTKGENYYFVSYNNDDAEQVSETACALNNAGIPLWYDYGLKYGDEWERQITERIVKAQALLLFFTKEILLKEKSYVKREYQIAQMFKKEIFVLFIEEVADQDVPVPVVTWWLDIRDRQSLNLWQWNEPGRIVGEVCRALGIDPDEGKYSDIAYPCLYCGKQIAAKDILFVERVGFSCPDKKYEMFLRWHGVHRRSRDKDNRMYYKVKPGINVVREDNKGFPIMIEDSLDHAYRPEELDSTGDTINTLSNGFSSFPDENSLSTLSDHTLHRISRRACPYCRCTLPYQFGMIDTHNILLLGCRTSGKTAFLINLLKELDSQLLGNNLGSVTLSDEGHLYLDSITREYDNISATPADVSYRGMMPVVCEFRNSRRESFIVFNDIPGEGTLGPSLFDHQGIAQSEALLLLLDPYTLGKEPEPDPFGLAGSFGGGQIVRDKCSEIELDKFLRESSEICNDCAPHIRNIVCVITKLDLLVADEGEIHELEGLSFLEDMGKAHCGGVDLQVLNRIERDLCQYVEKKYGLNLKDKLVSAFGRDVSIRILGVSTSSRKVGANGEILFDSDKFDPGNKHRIIEPLLSVMADLGLVPVKDEVKSCAPVENESKEIKKSLFSRIVGRRR